MTTVATSFTTSGTSTILYVAKNDHIDYSLSGTFVGTCILEKTENEQTFEIVLSATSAASARIHVETGGSQRMGYRWRVAPGGITSGTMVTSLADVDSTTHEFKRPDGETVLQLTEEGAVIGFRADAWAIGTTGVTPGVNNTMDIGSTSYRPRTIYAGTSLVTPLATLSTVNASGSTISNLLSGTTARIGTLRQPTAGGGVKVDDQIWFDTGDASGAVVLSFGETAAEGLQMRCIEEDVVVSGAAAKYVALTTSLPSGTVLLSAQSNNETAITASGTSSGVGLGLNGSDPDKYGFVYSKAKNAKINTLPDWAVLTSGEQIDVCAVMDSGTALGSGNFETGTVRVRLHYLQLASLANA